MLEKYVQIISENLPYNIGEFVYHDTPAGPKGKILDIRLNFYSKTVSYLLCFGPAHHVWVEEDEVTRDRQPE